jgi:photosystem II stability/assembly factor-like uncharacterized protein
MKKFLSLYFFFVIIFIASFSLLFNNSEKGIDDEFTSKDMLAYKIKSKRKQKAAYDKPMEAMKFYYDQRAFPIGYIPENWRSDALEHIRKFNSPRRTAKPTALSWTQVGPNNIGGRLRAIVINPSNTNILYVGAVSGGVWKTTNGGSSWFPLKDNMENLAVCALAMDPSNSNILYAGTGEGFFNYDAIRGEGIFKTTDGGTTWTQLSSTKNSNFYYVNDLQFDAATGRLYAATRNGLYYSANGGTSWSLVTGGSSGSSAHCMDIEIANTSPTTIFTAYGQFNQSAIYRSTNGGNSFNSIHSITGTGRIELATSPSNSQILYASFMERSTSEISQFQRSSDGGNSFAAVTVPGPSLTYNNYAGPQAWYNNILAVHPTNPDIVYAGGVDMFKTTNGGTTWSQITNWYTHPSYAYVHADHHAIAFHPTNPNTLFVGTDGGIYKSVNSGSLWTALNNGLAVTQFYYGAVHPTSNIFYGGTQDNGTLKSGSGLSWTEILGGDGGATEVDFNTPTTLYAEYVYLAFFKSTNNGASWTKKMNGIPVGTEYWDGTTDRCQFIAPFVMDPNNSQTLIAGTYKLYKTTDGANNWTAISDDLTGDGTGAQGATVSTIAVAKGNSNVIYVGCSNGRVQVTTNNGSSWTLATSGLPTLYVKDIEISSTNPGTAYVTFSGYTASSKIYKTSNYGTSWTNISSGLPNLPVNCVALNPDNASQIIVGTDLGIFSSSNDGGSWMPDNNGLANVSIADLDYRSSDKTLYAATHGRSMFKAALSGGTTPTEVTLIYDDGNPTSGVYEQLPNNGRIIANRLTAPNKNVKITKLIYYISGDHVPSGNASFAPVVYASSTAMAGVPGASPLYTHSSYTPTIGWNTIDISSANVSLTLTSSVEFFVGVKYNGINEPLIGYKSTSNGRGWEYNPSNAAWTQLDAFSPPFPATLYIRASVVQLTGVIDIDNNIPDNFYLSQNYPNPFNPVTRIKYSLPSEQFVSVVIYDLRGREVAKLVDNHQAPGTYTIEWNGKDNSGKQVSSGIYLYKIGAGKFSEMRKMILLK